MNRLQRSLHRFRRRGGKKHRRTIRAIPFNHCAAIDQNNVSATQSPPCRMMMRHARMRSERDDGREGESIGTHFSSHDFEFPCKLRFANARQEQRGNAPQQRFRDGKRFSHKQYLLRPLLPPPRLEDMLAREEARTRSKLLPTPETGNRHVLRFTSASRQPREHGSQSFHGDNTHSLQRLRLRCLTVPAVNKNAHGTTAHQRQSLASADTRAISDRDRMGEEKRRKSVLFQEFARSRMHRGKGSEYTHSMLQ